MTLAYVYTDPLLAGPQACETLPVTQRDIPTGDAGIAEILQEMRVLILESHTHPEVRKHAERAVSGIPWYDEAGMVEAIAHYILSVTQYYPDPLDSEYLQVPWAILCWVDAGRRPAVDCDDQVMLVLSMLRSVGIDGKMRVVSQTPDEELSHVYAVAVLSDGRELPVDLTLPAMPAGFRPVSETRAVEVEVSA